MSDEPNYVYTGREGAPGYVRGDLLVRFKRLRPCARLPERATPGSAGFDLYAAEHAVLQPGQRLVVGSGWATEFPPEWELQVRSRSGMAGRGITVANAPGTVDSDYRGELAALLVNNSAEPYLIEPGDRIAQILFARVPVAVLVEVDELSETARGTGGFGSTGR
jgi:dUTP pyrophosphatase